MDSRSSLASIFLGSRAEAGEESSSQRESTARSFLESNSTSLKQNNKSTSSPNHSSHGKRGDKMSKKLNDLLSTDHQQEEEMIMNRRDSTVEFQNQLERQEIEQEERRRELLSFLQHVNSLNEGEEGDSIEAGTEVTITLLIHFILTIRKQGDQPIFWSTETDFEEPLNVPEEWMTNDPKMLEAIQQMKLLDIQLRKKTQEAKKIKSSIQSKTDSIKECEFN